MQIHVARDGKELGVYSLEEVNRQLAAGSLRLTDLAWYEGAPGWAALSTVPGVSATPSSSAAAPVSPAVTATPSSPTAAPVSPAVIATPSPLVPQRKNEQLAVLSLIFSLLGVCGFCCGLFLASAVAGIVCGHIALSRIKANPELEGRNLAVAGLAIGYVAIAGWLIWALLFGGLAVLNGITESMTKH
jgi:hypothetical protein